MPLSLAFRGCAIGLLTVAYGATAVAMAAVLRIAAGREAAARHLSRRLVALLQRLGPAFIKAGQILGTRRDVLPAALCDALSVLRCHVRPISEASARAALLAAYGGSLDEVFTDIEWQPVASGSIACVYRAALTDHRQVAIKLRRPGIRRLMARDLALMAGAGALAERLPAFRGTPVRGLVDQLCAAAALQIDFAREAANLVRLRQELSSVARVRVPRVEEAACREGVLVMEFVPGLQADAADTASVATRRACAARTLAAMYHMLFVNGFVHCDLHRGNLYFTEAGQVVILDAGFTVQLSERLRRLFAEFFMFMSLGSGSRCAEIVIESADAVDPDADAPRFRAQMAALVDRSWRLKAGSFSLIRFSTEMFDLQRACGLHGATELVFPLLSLLVIEGTVRELDPDADFQDAARGPVVQALFGARAAS